MRYLFFSIILLFTSYSLYSQNNQKIFEYITQKLVVENDIQVHLVENDGNKKIYFIKIIDSLYQIDEYKKIQLTDNQIIYILQEDQLFFYQVKKWLEFVMFEVRSKKIKVKVKILEKEQGNIKTLYEMILTYDKTKILKEIEK
jgi:hypothetical protein